MSCKNKNVCTQKSCGCPIPDLSARCVIYDGQELSCIGADTPDNLNNLLKKFDKSICEKLDFILQKGDLKNVGSGIEFYKGINNLGQKELRTLISSDGSVIIELGQEGETVDIKVEGVTLFTLENESTTADANIVSSFDPQENKYTFKGLKSNSITIAEDQEGNITLEVSAPSLTTVTSQDNSVTIVEDNGNYDLSVEAASQIQSDLGQLDSNEVDFVKGKNLQKTVDDPLYQLTPEDNNHTIILNSINNAIQVGVPASIPNNFFVGFIQVGNNSVTFTTNDIDVKPAGKTYEIEGDGYNAAIEKIDGGVFLLGSLKDEVV